MTKKSKNRQHPKKKNASKKNQPSKLIPTGENILSEKTRQGVDQHEPCPPEENSVPPTPRNIGNRSRYQFKFDYESKGEIEKRIQQSKLPLVYKSEHEKEIDVGVIHPTTDDSIIPKRPPWNYTMTKQQVEHNEEVYFKEYLDMLKSQPWSSNLSHFEHNLETWRQLWRVLEKSDVVTMIADSRYPMLHFVPALHKYITETLNKPMILVLNKIDTVPPENIIGWKHYFLERYPTLKVVPYSSFPKDCEANPSDAPKVLPRRRRKKGGFRVYGLKNFLTACISQVPGKNFDQLKKKIELEAIEDSIASPSDSHDTMLNDEILRSRWEESSQKHFITIGLVGFPNVGKSSFLNGLMGRKVVSVSKTPGHTKYFQTIFVTNDVVLCDCPGLIFPTIMDKQWQIISGIFPPSQVREPYTSIAYIAERFNLVHALNLTHPNNESTWSGWDICVAWALKRGFLTAKSGRPDTYRAANHLLRLTIDGRIGVYQLPPGFTQRIEYFANHSEAIQIRNFLRKYSNLLYPGISQDDKLNTKTDDSSASDEFTMTKNRFDALNF